MQRTQVELEIRSLSNISKLLSITQSAYARLQNLVYPSCRPYRYDQFLNTAILRGPMLQRDMAGSIEQLKPSILENFKSMFYSAEG